MKKRGNQQQELSEHEIMAIRRRVAQKSTPEQRKAATHRREQEQRAGR